MKWCFLISNFQFLPEFFGKLSAEILERGDECLVIFGSKVAEYDKKKFFPDGVKFISMIEWQVENYGHADNDNKKDFSWLPWKDFFSILDRSPLLKIDYARASEITLRTVKFFEFIFEREKPGVVISEPPACLFSLIACRLCGKNNAAYLGVGDSRINNRLDIYDEEFTCSKYYKTFEEINRESILKEEKDFIRDFMNKFITHEQMPSYVKWMKVYFSQIGLIRHFLKRIKETFRPLSRYSFSRKKYRLLDVESETMAMSFSRAFFIAERKKLRIYYQKKFFESSLVEDRFGRINEEKFFFFPLHYQPESSTNVYAAYYCDQLNTVKNIALSLPFSYKLYVKEHPMSAGARTSQFYEELEKIPNIVLVSPTENIQEIIKNSSGVVALTGTPGLEAALSGKPVYVLGDVFYSYHPLCRKVESFKDLEEKIKNDLENIPDVNDLENINNKFVASYLRNTIPGNTTSAVVKNDANDYRQIYENLLGILHKEKINNAFLPEIRNDLSIKPRKVVFFTPLLATGGMERVISDLSINLPENIEKITVVFTNQEPSKYDFKGKIISLGLPLSKHLLPGIYYFFIGIRRLRKIIKKENPDYVVSFGFNANLMNVFSCKQSILRADTFLSSAHGSIGRLLIKTFFNKAYKIVCVSKGVAQDLVDNFEMKKDKIKIIYNFLDSKKISGLSAEPLDQEYEDIFTNPVVINVGRIEERKGQRYLIRVFKEVKEKVKNAKLVILGSGELEQDLKQVAKDLGLEKDVYFLGWQKNPFKFLAKSKVFVSSSLIEGFSMVIIEAMACGLPIITTSCKYGPVEILSPKTDIETKVEGIEYKEYGIVTPPLCDRGAGKPPEASAGLEISEKLLKEAIIKVLTDEKIADDLRRKSLNRAADFDVFKIMNNWDFLRENYEER